MSKLNQDEQFPLSLLQFNQNFSTLIVSTPSGYSLVRSTDENFEEEFYEEKSRMYIVERLFNSSLLIMVSRDDNYKLLAYHFRKRMLICNYRYSSVILSVKINRKRLVVCVEDGIMIHCILTLNLLHNIEETPPNRRGIMALCGNEETSYLAYPGSAREGTVIVLNTLTFQNVATIVAHNGLLAAMSFNTDGNLLATASEKGTVIRVFSLPCGNRLIEFRRGMARCATISCLNFSLDDAFLVAASNTETVHIFKTELKRDHDSTGSMGDGGSRKAYTDNDCNDTASTALPTSSSSTWYDWLNSTVRASTNYLPTQVSEMISQDRAFAFARLTTAAAADMPKVAAIVNQKDSYRLIVASWDGLVNLFDFDPEKGGEAHCVKCVNLLSFRGSHASPASHTRHSRRIRGASSSSVDSAGNGAATYSSSPLNIHSSSPGNNHTDHRQYSSIQDSMQSGYSYNNGQPLDTLISEGLDNLRLEDSREFPSLSPNMGR